MMWGWPQYLIAALLLMGIGVELAKDGQAKTGRHSFWTDLFATAFMVWVLYMGGFWS